MHRRLPPLAIVLGIGGLIPFIVCGIGAVSAGNDRPQEFMTALLGYAAVILAFLGGVHWGFVLEAPLLPGGHQAAQRDNARLAFGVLPSLIGWAGLIAPLVLPTDVGLAIMIVGFLGTALVETQLRRSGFVLGAYMWMRWALTIVVMLVLITVLTLRLLNATILI